MSDKRLAQGQTPILRTRPATMLTAIGLCVIIMILQLVPEFRDGGWSRLAAPSLSTVQ